MKLPGVATLSFQIEPDAANRCTIVMTARFRPRGLLGIAYWYAVLPLHGIVFRGMLKGLVRTAQLPPHTHADVTPGTSEKPLTRPVY
jgi:hypothetical protein